MHDEKPILYVARFRCGLVTEIEASNVKDVPMLQHMASRVDCPECALAQRFRRVRIDEHRHAITTERTT